MVDYNQPISTNTLVLIIAITINSNIIIITII